MLYLEMTKGYDKTNTPQKVSPRTMENYGLESQFKEINWELTEKSSLTGEGSSSIYLEKLSNFYGSVNAVCSPFWIGLLM